MAEKNKTYEKEARKLLKNPNLIDEYVRTCHERYVGREDILKLVKLATVSRHFDRGISIVLSGTASVGKSELFNTVLNTVDANAYERFTRTSEKYLFYVEGGLSHKIILFNELSGTKEAAHNIRTALSEGSLSMGTVVGGAAEDLFVSAEGTVFFTTYASDNLDYELDTRVIKVELNYNSELGRKVLSKKAQKAQNGSSVVEPMNPLKKQASKANGSTAQALSFELWKEADRIIEPCEVVIPFASRLSQLFPTRDERYMRDFDKVITLIKSSALLHKFQRAIRDNNTIIASHRDYEIVYDLSTLITQSISNVSEEVHAFLVKAADLRGKYKTVPTREMIQKNLNVSLATIKRRVKSALEADYIEVRDKGSQQKIFVREMPEIGASPLPEPEKLFRK